MDKTTTLRHEAYAFLGLDDRQKAYLSKAFKDHDDARLINMQQLWKSAIPKIEGINRLKKKINEYLYKAKRMPQTPKLISQKETLELCLQWLTEEE
jgi:hypothetical protein